MNAVTAADADVEYLAGLRSAWTRAFVVGELIGFVPPVLLATVLAPVWAMALTAMGYLQWRVLRVTIPASGRWVPVTTGAWLIGIMIPVVALSTVPNDRPVHLAVAAAVAMGLTVGASTGRTLHSLLAQRRLPLAR
jgi:hypothetical protein